MLLNLKRKRFGRLVALKRIRLKSTGKIGWKCICDCGRKTKAITASLINGNTKSCGCLNLDIITKHGMYKSKLYGVWSSMIRRCHCPTHRAYKNYGGRGIKVYRKWKHNFKVFYKWAMKNGYKQGLTIERIDNNKSYKPSNCKWATYSEQNLNRDFKRNKTSLEA